MWLHLVQPHRRSRGYHLYHDTAEVRQPLAPPQPGLSLAILDQSISFAPAQPAATVGSPYSAVLTATDASGASVSALVTLTVNPVPARPGNDTIQDESSGKVTAIDPNFTGLMAGTKKLGSGMERPASRSTPAVRICTLSIASSKSAWLCSGRAFETRPPTRC